MKRPIGVIVSAIVLGLIGLLQLLVAAGMVASGFTIRTHPQMPVQPGQPDLSPETLAAILWASAGFIALLAAWSIATVVGLAMLKPWSRYSILTLGGCLTALAVLSIASVAAISAVLPQSSTGRSPLPPGLLLTITGVFYAPLALIGIAWLIYFTRPKVRAVFAGSMPAATLNPTYANGYGYRPIPGLSPALPGSPSSASYRPQQDAAYPAPVRILGVLLMISAVSCGLFALLPFPGFLGGFIFTGLAGHALYASLAVVSGIIGVGLWRMDNRARIATFGLIVLGCFNVTLAFLPWYQQRFQDYNHILLTRMHLPATPVPIFQGPFLIETVIAGLAIYGFAGWVLYRYRAAFVPRTPLAPTPAYSAAESRPEIGTEQ